MSVLTPNTLYPVSGRHFLVFGRHFLVHFRTFRGSFYRYSREEFDRLSKSATPSFQLIREL